MSCEIAVLRALLRLSRRRTPATLEQLLVRVRDDQNDVLRALRALARSGLVYRSQRGLRLTMAGLAVAVASTAAPRTRTDRTTRPRTVAPLAVRRAGLRSRAA